MTQATIDATGIKIDRDDLVKLTLDLCGIPSTDGQETGVGTFVFDWMRRDGFDPKKVGMFADPFNVLGTPGRGGYGLIFNGLRDIGRSKSDRWSAANVSARFAIEGCSREKPEHC